MAEATATAPATATDDDGFHHLFGLDELPPGGKRAVDLGGRSILICNAGGEIYAVANACTHAAIPLLSGKLRGCVLECPLHGGRFDLRDGRPVAGPPRRNLERFATRVIDGRIAVRLT